MQPVWSALCSHAQTITSAVLTGTPTNSHSPATYTCTRVIPFKLEPLIVHKDLFMHASGFTLTPSQRKGEPYKHALLHGSTFPLTLI